MTTASTVTTPRTRARPSARGFRHARAHGDAPAPAPGLVAYRIGSLERFARECVGHGGRTRDRRDGIACSCRHRAGAASPQHGPGGAPQLRVVESPADRRRRVLRTRRAVVFGTLITALAVFTIVAFHVMLAQGQVRLARLQTELSGAERDYQHARYAHAQAASPERIVDKASQIGLVTPDRPPVAVAVPDPAAPSTGGSGSQTLDGYTHVKKSLADGP